MITRLLVANRGEIARRVFRTCRSLGISTVAVFSDADAGAPHVAEADLAVRLPGVSAAETYLDAERILAACRASGADAVHPGYGFLSENAGFARAVLDAGLVWVGPPPEAIAAMGVKIGAKRLMEEAGVPVLPSLDLAAPAEFPLLVKASAGGGGRGMRVVREPGGLAEAVESARRESAAAFGDGTVFAEPLLERARHVEVQVLADRHGGLWTLGERECSVQRRHQKVIEECPSPGVTAETRQVLYDAAARAARAIGYVGAGTVEFLVKDGRVAFLEMNTRLQVEHPVTELVYGVDLVRLQIELAEGAALPPSPPEPSGWAVEARLYAEDASFVPQSGRLWRFEVPGEVRVDAGVESGSVVPPHYDAMLAKVIAHGATRAEAVRRLAGALRRARLHGVPTNRDLLLTVLKSRDFAAGNTHTGLLDGPLTGTPKAPEPAESPSASAAHHPAEPPSTSAAHHPAGAPSTSAAHQPAGALGVSGAPAASEPGGDLVPLAAALAMAAANRRRARVLAGLPSGWRNVRSQPRRVAFEETGPVVYDPLPPGVHVVSATPEAVVLERDGVRRTYEVAGYEEDGPLYVDHAEGAARLTPLPRLPEPAEHAAPGSLLAPMPGSVLRVEVAPGDRVTRGQTVLVLEAMKMEHRITAPADGVVSGVHVEKGRQVGAGAVLAIIQEENT